MRGSKIVIIGAGSHFTLGLVGDFFRVNDLWGSELVLMDIDRKKLEAVRKIIAGIVQKRKVDLKVSATSNLGEALENAGFVIVTIRAGGLNALREIINIPLQFGTMEVVGDTVGPSGILKGMLEMPAILDVAYKIKEISPHAVMINFTNPMTPICRVVRKAVGLEIIGLCHGFNQIRSLASKILKNLDFSRENLKVDAVGINHLTWTLDIKHKGKSLYGDFLNCLSSKDCESVIANEPYLIGRELYKVFKMPPTLNDRHTSEFFHYLYDWINNTVYGSILKKVSGYIDYEKRTLRRDVIEEEENRTQSLMRIANGLEEPKISPIGEYALDIISAIENKRKMSLMAVNMPNVGTINGINPEHVVEVPAEMNGYGLASTRRLQVPQAIVSLLNQHLDKFEILVDGILEKDRGLIVQAMALDPLTPSPEKAEKIYDLFVQRCSAMNILTIWKPHLTSSPSSNVG